MTHYTFSELNAEFNEFFAQYGEYPTECDLQEYLKDVTHLDAELKQCLEHSLRPHIVNQLPITRPHHCNSSEALCLNLKFGQKCHPIKFGQRRAITSRNRKE